MKYLFLALFVFCFASASAQVNQKYITVNGTSELILSADQINFTVEIKIIDATVEDSKKTNDNDLNELLTILKNIGISVSDINISPIVLGKNYEFIDKERKQKGFYTEVNVFFLLKDLSKYYDLTNNLALSNAFEIVNSSYSISNYELQQKSAYEKALKAAKEKAEYMVKTLGSKLGDVLEIDENNYLQSFSNSSTTMTRENSPMVDISGKVTIRKSVKIKFAIN
jgi:uncharacterized protein YggE